MKPVFAAVTLLAASLPALAGWYEVSSYEGTIGAYPVHVSIQTFKHLGASDEDGKGRVVGSYYYDSKRIPIALHGKQQPDGTMKLCEVQDVKALSGYNPNYKAILAKDPCPFLLTATSAGMTGKWQNEKTSLEVALKTVGTLDNNESPMLTGKMDVPMWSRGAKHMYIGSYELYEERVIMRRLRAVNIATGKVEKIADLACKPSDDGCEPGMLYTDIYQNLSADGTSYVSVGYADGRMGTDREVKLKGVK